MREKGLRVDPCRTFEKTNNHFHIFLRIVPQRCASLNTHGQEQGNQDKGESVNHVGSAVSAVGEPRKAIMAVCAAANHDNGGESSL